MRIACVVLSLALAAGCRTPPPAGVLPEQVRLLGHPTQSLEAEIASIKAEVSEHNKTVPDTGPLIEVTGSFISLSCTPAMDSPRKYPTEPTILSAQEYADAIRPFEGGKTRSRKRSSHSTTVSAPHVRLRSGQREALSLHTKGSYVEGYEKVKGFWIPTLREYPVSFTLLDVSAEAKDGAVILRKVNCKLASSSLIQTSGRVRIAEGPIELTWSEPLIQTRAAALDAQDGIRLGPDEYLFLPLAFTVERAASNLRAVMSDRDISDGYRPRSNPDESTSSKFAILTARIVEEDAKEEKGDTGSRSHSE